MNLEKKLKDKEKDDLVEILPFAEKIKEEYPNAKFSPLILKLNESDLKTGNLLEIQKKLYE